MDYRQAKNIREKSFGTLLAEQEGGFGTSLKAALSQKSKARAVGLKEKFDPLNIAKTLTGGSNWAPAMLGKLFNVDKKRVDYFSGVKPKSTAKLESSESLNSPEAVDCLGYIYKSLKQSAEDKKLADELKRNRLEEEDSEEESRNQEIVKALTARRKKKEEKPYRDEKGKFAKKPTEEAPKAPAKEAPKPPTKAPEKPPTAAPAPKPEVKPPTAAPAPKPEVKPPTAAPAPKPEVKPSTTKVTPKKPSPSIKPPVISGGDKSVMEMVKKHEGVRTKPYKDSLGLWTVGVGHLIGDGKTLPEEWKNRELTMQEVDELFAKDFQKHKEMAMAGPGWNKANTVGQAALIDLTFNMGAWWKKFKNAAKALDAGDFNRAADELQYKDPATKEPSLWYQQVKGRAVTIVDMIRGGKISKEEVQSPNLAGDKIDSSSKENKNLKADVAASNDKAAPVVSSTNVNSQQSQTPQSSSQGDDTNAYQKKAKGK